MPKASHSQSFGVFARWRPLADAEQSDGEIIRQSTQESSSLYSVTIDRGLSKNDRPWKSAAAFTTVFEPEDDNETVYTRAVSPAIAKVLTGASCNFFAYGHTGSGKTHTIIGYDYEVRSRLGVCLAAASRLFEALAALGLEETQLGVGLRVFELRKNHAFDLLNGRTACHIREGYDGKTHIRGPTEMLDNGKVRVCPIVQYPCWTFDALREKLHETLSLREVGSSSVHSLSSRTHAVIELEVVTPSLIEARQEVTDRQSELVPVGKRATDAHLEETMKGLMRGPDGGWITNPEVTINQALIDAAETEKKKFESRVQAAEEAVEEIITSSGSPSCIGGKLAFVDLAGSEYQQEGNGAKSLLLKQTPQERQEGRQINTDLLALKEVIRAVATKQARIPFRASPLTMVLREHFRGPKEGSSAMIVTASPAKDQYPAILNSLKYSGLLGVAAA